MSRGRVVSRPTLTNREQLFRVACSHISSWDLAYWSKNDGTSPGRLSSIVRLTRSCRTDSKPLSHIHEQTGSAEGVPMPANSRTTRFLLLSVLSLLVFVAFASGQARQPVADKSAQSANPPVASAVSSEGSKYVGAETCSAKLSPVRCISASTNVSRNESCGFENRRLLSFGCAQG